MDAEARVEAFVSFLLSFCGVIIANPTQVPLFMYQLQTTLLAALAASRRAHAIAAQRQLRPVGLQAAAAASAGGGIQGGPQRFQVEHLLRWGRRENRNPKRM